MTTDFANYPSLANAMVFITGGASGIGAEIVRARAAQRARIGMVDLDVEAGPALAENSAENGTKASFESCDLRDIYALKRTFALLSERLGPASVLERISV